MHSDGTSNGVVYRFEHSGHCLPCGTDVMFESDSQTFRDSLKCPNCGSLPRQRAIWHVMTHFYPNWRELHLHEGSPGWDVVSQRLASECENYIASQLDTNHTPGTQVRSDLPCKTYRVENLEHQSFESESFDLVIAQDVFEHVFHPDAAIREIARTLKPGGAVIMTVPIVRRHQQSRRRASLDDGVVVHSLPPEFHGNPVSDEGSLVTVDWGYDIVSYLQHHSGLSFLLVHIDDIDLGIRAQLNEVLVGFKLGLPDLV